MTTELRYCRCCGAQIRFGMLACRNHWYLLPVPLRNAILLTYRGGNKRAYVENVRSAEKVWQDMGVWRARSADEMGTSSTSESR